MELISFSCSIFLASNYICIPESFNTNISHQHFDYKITFLNSQHWNTNSKGDFVPSQKLVLNVRIKYFWYTKINLTQVWYDKFNN